MSDGIEQPLVPFFLVVVDRFLAFDGRSQTWKDHVGMKLLVTFFRQPVVDEITMGLIHFCGGLVVRDFYGE